MLERGRERTDLHRCGRCGRCGRSSHLASWTQGARVQKSYRARDKSGESTHRTLKWLQIDRRYLHIQGYTLIHMRYSHVQLCTRPLLGD